MWKGLLRVDKFLATVQRFELQKSFSDRPFPIQMNVRSRTPAAATAPVSVTETWETAKLRNYRSKWSQVSRAVVKTMGISEGKNENR
ncbi:hypothetical protein HZH68_000953 [Vespula germanica]|uniref:Uncharacterized protein n=2 Tax=Vespula TaxID=7451 RepID=A0A834NUI2_VESGE|nr:hypothetical protein HZH68_000953 [Vespula germanica]